MKKTRIKTTPLASREAFNEAVDSAAELQARIAVIIARRDRAILRVTTRFNELMAPLVQERDAKITKAEAYAEEHRGELLPDKKKKSGETSAAIFGFRTGNRTVKLMSNVSEENAIAALKAFDLNWAVRKKEEIAKDVILGVAEDDTRVPVDPSLANPEKFVALSDVGLRIFQGETFYVEPKVEDPEHLKAPEANAA